MFFSKILKFINIFFRIYLFPKLILIINFLININVHSFLVLEKIYTKQKKLDTFV